MSFVTRELLLVSEQFLPIFEKTDQHNDSRSREPYEEHDFQKSQAKDCKVH